MKSKDDYMPAYEHCDQSAERIRLAYSHALNTFLQVFTKYKQLKKRFNNETLEKCSLSADRTFFDKNGAIRWEIVHPMMPKELEENIKKEFALLSEKEIKLCCLLLFDVPVCVISNILPYTNQSVHTKTYEIKKKTGVKNLKNYLTRLLLPEGF